MKLTITDIGMAGRREFTSNQSQPYSMYITTRDRAVANMVFVAGIKYDLIVAALPNEGSIMLKLVTAQRIAEVALGEWRIFVRCAEFRIHRSSMFALSMWLSGKKRAASDILDRLRDEAFLTAYGGRHDPQATYTR